MVLTGVANNRNRSGVGFGWVNGKNTFTLEYNSLASKGVWIVQVKVARDDVDCTTSRNWFDNDVGTAILKIYLTFVDRT